MAPCYISFSFAILSPATLICGYTDNTSLLDYNNYDMAMQFDTQCYLVLGSITNHLDFIISFNAFPRTIGFGTVDE